MSPVLTSSALPEAPRSRGRPRSFDMDAVLNQAERVFRAKGFHAASIHDLAEATGLTTGSLYKAFTDKRAVFRAVFDRYADRRLHLVRRLAAEAQNGLEAVQAVVGDYVAGAQGQDGWLGCLVSGSISQLANLDDETAAHAVSIFRRNEAMITEQVRRGQADGSVRADLDPQIAGAYLWCVVQGVRLVGKTERAPGELGAVAELALRLLI